MAKKQFEWADLKMKSFYFIAHLFDRVLVGEYGKPSFDQLVDALDKGTIIEAHFFNEEQEVYAVQENLQLVAYEPMKHTPDGITRCYNIELNKASTYNTLKVKEYLDYEDNLAYIRQTVLCALEKRSIEGKK